MKKNITLGLWAALVSSPVLILSPVMAQDGEVDEIIVSATGIPTPAHEIGASVDIITAADLERQQISYLQDALKLKGVHIAESGGRGSLADIQYRGMRTKYVDLRIDGISMFDPGGDRVIWSHADAAGSERIELLSGSQAVLFGSNTISGVISQFTAIGGETQNATRLELGEQATRQIGLTGKGTANGWAYGYALNDKTTDGISDAAGPGNHEADGFETQLASFRLLRALTDSVSLELVGRFNEGEKEGDDYDPNPPYLAADALGKRDAFSRQALRGVVHYETDNAAHRFGVTNFVSENDDIEANQLAGQREASRQKFDYFGTLSLSDNVRLVAGAESVSAEYENTDAVYTFEKREVDSDAVFALATFALDDSHITVAARHDDHELFGSHASYRATLAHRLADMVSARLAYGRGFKAPSLFELYASFTGNPDLKSETSESIEAGLDWAVSPNADIAITFFDTRIEDRIDFHPSTFSSIQITGETKTRGFDVSLDGRLSNRLRLGVNLNYANSREPSGNSSARVPRVPRLTAASTLDYQVNDVTSLGLSLRHMHNAVEGSYAFDDFTVVDLRAAYTLPNQVKVYGRLENAGDEDYETARGYNTLGRTLYVGLTAAF